MGDKSRYLKLYESGTIARQHGDYLTAEKMFNEALLIEPLGTAGLELCRTLFLSGKAEEGDERLLKELELHKSCEKTAFALGLISLQFMRKENAVRFFMRAVELAPGKAEYYNGLGCALKELQRFKEASLSFKKALSLKDNYGEALTNLASILSISGDNEEAIQYLKKAVGSKDVTPVIVSNYLLRQHYCLNAENMNITAGHKIFNKIFAPENKNKKSLGIIDPTGRKIRVGFVSGDFREHPVAWFMLPLFKHFNKDKFEIAAYSDATVHDSVSELIKREVNEFIDISSLNDDEFSSRIREDKIDILFDLSGHTARNRLTVFANRAAPLQVTYLGYPDTTGLENMDYRIVDQFTDPSFVTYGGSEKLIRLNRCFLTFSKPGYLRPVRDFQPAVQNGYVTFGSFNNSSKINGSVIEAWSEILKKAADSKLVLKFSGGGNDEIKDGFINKFASHGIDKSRIIIEGWSSKQSHFKRYEDIDIALDTFSYNGVTTTLEALWSGVPVVTLNGNIHASRVGYSILKAIGLELFAPSSVEKYIEVASALSFKVDSLFKLSKTVRSRIAASSLSEGESLARAIENSFFQMINNYNKQA
ncbi:MAG: hypothetical protein JXR91_00655 [Deltaproteobacteria bacterium]|nr:hypothetical protein [Deltaproteobacteria bacterium]